MTLRTKSARTFMLLGAASSAMLMHSKAAAQAQDGNQDASDRAVEAVANSDDAVIVVEGIRASLASALNEKRLTDNIVEVINAEDVGKLPDQNLAEVLENVTGIQIDRAAGIGTAVSIRGTDLNRIEINGNSTTPSGDNRGGISFEDLPAALIASVKVTKVPTADGIEGSVGGTINLRTYRGLSLKEPLISLRAQGEYAENSDTIRPLVSATLGDRFDTGIGEIGVVLSASYRDQRVQEDNLRVSPAPQAARDRDGDGVDDPPFFRPNFTTETYNGVNLENLALSGSVEWQASSSLKLFAEGTYTDQNREQLGQSLIGRGFGGAGVNPNLGTAIFETLSEDAAGEFDVITQTDVDLVQLRSRNDSQTRFTDSLILAGGGQWEKGLVSIDAEVAYSESATDQSNLRFFFDVRNPDAGNFFAGSAIIRNPAFFDNTSGTLSFGPRRDEFTADLLDAAFYGLRNVQQAIDAFDNSEFAQRIDFDVEVNSPFLSVIEFGVRANQTRSERQRATFSSPLNANLGGGITGLQLAEFLVASPGNFFDFAPTDNYFRDFLTIDPALVLSNPQSLIDAVNAAGGLTGDDALTLAPEFDTSQAFRVEEDTLAGYVKFNFDSTIGSIPIRGNAGLRVVRTSQEAIGNQGAPGQTPVIVSESSNYLEFLPSASLVLAPSNDLLVRFGFARDIRRPNFSELSITTNFPDNAGTPVRIGNPQLTPETVLSFDAGVEYYFGTSNFISAGVFYKERSDIITQELESVPFGTPGPNCPSGIFNPFASPGDSTELGVCVDLISNFNAETGDITGIELALQFSLADYESLGFLSGFGVIANYTYQDGNRSATFGLPRQFNDVLDNVAPGDEIIFPLPIRGLSENAYNITLFYEKYGLTARARYTYRDGFSFQDAAGSLTFGGPLIIGPRGQLNANIAYELTDNIQLQVAGINLLKETREQRILFPNGPVFRETDADRRVTFGARVKF